ncbi:M20 family metallopeptidase [Sporosarcina sp. G11-34]|uniref:M20 family metallopeptidase n=1 Tax=Sporosarcina sp. G11-34 TaxID=2849605 RepID=UPI0022A9581E|nr:M20 family metallopeptidase [Sporosarcina sp. G11-34]MCZ2257396.1 M20 family metallopeptidase [Sporosarcina sp. G11-34]
MSTETSHTFLFANEEHIKQDLLTLVKAESPSHDIQLLKECELVVKEIFQKHFADRFTLQEFKSEGNGTHLLYEIKDDSKPRILLMSHYDTVWNKGELQIVEEGDTIYGPGIFDMKAGLISSIWAIDSLLHVEKELPFSPVFLFTADEETGSESSRDIIETVAKTCDAVFVMEPAEAHTDALKTERKGVGRFDIEVTGKSAHAGNHHEDGVNAIVEIAKLIVKLEKLTDYSTGTTVNVGTIHGGSTSNVVPEKAKIEVDFRITSAEEGERIEKVIQSLTAEDDRVSLSIKGGINRPPLEKNEKNKRLFELAQRTGQKLGMNITESSVGGGSDGNFTSPLGIPTIDGLGIPGDGAHARNEHILFNKFTEKCAFVAELCMEFSEAKIKENV